MNHCTDHDQFAARVDAAADLLFHHVQHCTADRAGLPCPVCQAFELLTGPAAVPPMIHCHPVPASRLADVLAGRLLTELGQSKPHRGTADWR